DFHYRSLKQQIAPLVILPVGLPSYVLARVQTDDLPATLDYIEARWDEAAPGYPFSYTFLDSRFAAIYDDEERLAQVFGVFALLAIGIACMGLFGLAAYVAGTRTREIGIRKVLGASVAGIVALLSKDFFRLVLVAFVVAAPVAYVAMHYWLEDFAYRIDVSLWTLLAAGSVALTVAVLSVSYQAITAALANPADVIRHE
ncbi:MAG: ABC transporter permease, partial [Rhodothermales bacterium]